MRPDATAAHGRALDTPRPAGGVAAHLDFTLRSLDADDRLGVDGGYPVSMRPLLQRSLGRLGRLRLDFGVAHGDLAPRDLVPQREAPGLIDRGGVTTGPTPWTDAHRVLVWALFDERVDLADFDEFATAAGLTGPGDRADVARFAALHALDTARWASDRRPDPYPESVRSCRIVLEALLPLITEG